MPYLHICDVEYTNPFDNKPYSMTVEFFSVDAEPDFEQFEDYIQAEVALTINESPTPRDIDADDIQIIEFTCTTEYEL